MLRLPSRDNPNYVPRAVMEAQLEEARKNVREVVVTKEIIKEVIVTQPPQIITKEIIKEVIPESILTRLLSLEKLLLEKNEEIRHLTEELSSFKNKEVVAVEQLQNVPEIPTAPELSASMQQASGDVTIEELPLINQLSLIGTTSDESSGSIVMVDFIGS